MISEFFSENHLITLPIISHDQENYEMTFKNSLVPFLVCVCFKERNEESFIYDEKKKNQSLNRAPTISAFEA